MPSLSIWLFGSMPRGQDGAIRQDFITFVGWILTPIYFPFLATIPSINASDG